MNYESIGRFFIEAMRQWHRTIPRYIRSESGTVAVGFVSCIYVLYSY